MTTTMRNGVCRPCVLPILLAAAMLPGCALFKGGDPGVGQSQPHPMLAAARDNQVSMFGDIGDKVSPTYFTRAAVSLQRHTFTEVGNDNDADVDPTGGRIIFSSTRHNATPDLYIKSVEGVGVIQLTADPASDIQPAFSPDGQRVAFASDRGGQWDIWIIDTDGGAPIRITDSPADEVHPSWSPDGQQLVYCSLSAQGGQWALWIVPAQSGASRKFIGYGLFPEWSPTGDTIIFQRARERGTRRFSIWTLTLIDGEPRYPTEIATSAREAYTLPTWSSDASRVAFASVSEWPAASPTDVAPFVAHDIWVMSADGRAKARLTDGHAIALAPVFSPDGRIFFTSNRGGFDNVWSLLPSGEAIGANDVERVTATPLQSREARVIGNGESAAEAPPSGGS